jgi:Ser/Thr protein kinase RdoA (MazF antagonist)
VGLPTTGPDAARLALLGFVGSARCWPAADSGTADGDRGIARAGREGPSRDRHNQPSPNPVGIKSIETYPVAMLESQQNRMGTAIAEAFGLGSPAGDVQPVSGGRSHLMWRLRTTDGDWAVKVLNRSREPWWMNDYLIAAQVEQTAWAGGIAMPRPLSPLHPAAPMLADFTVDDVVYSARVHEWCAGQPLGDAGPDVLRWVGETIATVHALPVELDVADAVVYGLRQPHEWQRWLDDAPDDVPADFLTEVRAHLPDIAHATEIFNQDQSEIRDQLTPVFTHRDVKPDNLLLTSSSPVLVDWDEAGLDIAEWEIIRAALTFSRDGDGWDQIRFDQVVRSYQGASGRELPAVRACFAGVLEKQLGAASFLLWRALGHRPVTPAERSKAYGHCLEFLTDLRASLRYLPEWTYWLRGDQRTLTAVDRHGPC